MSSNRKTTNTNSYNPGSMSTYQNLITTAGNSIQQNVQNPFGNANAVQLNSQQQQSNAQLANNNNTAYAARSQAAGMNPNSPAYAYGQRMNAVQNSQNMGRSSNNLLLGDLGTRMQSLQTAMNFRPLQTGGTATQSTTGTGTWLPQLAQAGIQGGAAAYNHFANQNDYSSANQTVDPSKNSGSGMYDLNDEDPANLGMNMTPSWGGNFGNPNGSNLWGMGEISGGAGNLNVDPYGYGSGGW